MLTVVVTGAEGFIGKTLCLRLAERAFEVRKIDIGSTNDDLRAAVADADAVVHLAGVNRPKDPADFVTGNRDAVECLTEILGDSGRSIPVILTSSIQAAKDSSYGASKLAGERVLLDFAEATGGTAHVLRLPNVFGKWCRPNYNSAVATFCHNIARDLPITVNDPAAPLSLVYVDDVATAIIALIEAGPAGAGYRDVAPVYQTTVGEVADLISRFHADRGEAMMEPVGTGLVRALYATYVAALPEESFSYPLINNVDPRGGFCEVLKTRTSGQFSFLTAHPGVTRGGHYHHTKVEKFVVVQGTARFRFRHILTNEVREIVTSGDTPVAVETIPGWTHDITNIGEDVMISLLWANELFSREEPDTIFEKV